MASTQKVAVHFRRRPGESIPVGTLAQQDRRVFFEYHAEWLATRFELSPLCLPARPGLHEHTDREIVALPGLFDDSLPDGWGLLLMDRHFRRLGLDPDAVSPLDRLVYLGTHTMGALTYHPPAEREGIDGAVFDLHELAHHAQDLYAGQATEVLSQLLLAGGSPGGARPKVLVGYNPATGAIISGEDDLPEGFEHWIVKFAAREDATDAGPMEYAYALMAGDAGLLVPQVRLFETDQGDRFFGAKRFDRTEGNRRHHVHTFGNLIQANFRIPACDYADLLKVTSYLTKNRQDVMQAFRAMVFNVLAHNRDDHAKNFAFIFDDNAGSWSFSPSYDLTYATGVGLEHTTTVTGEGKRPAWAQMDPLARRFDISPAESKAIYAQVSNAVSSWPSFGRRAGVSAANRDRISARLAEVRSW